ncbi:PolC-type DNA polymerase III, partial [Staphylococcus simulans]
MFEIKLGGRYKKEKVQREKGRNLLDFPNEYVVIDIETTGLDSKYDAIIEVAGIRYIDGVEKERYQELINPQYPIDSFISELTGITNEMLKNARFENEVMNDFYSFIGNSIVVAHNAHFDINFVYDSLQKNYDIKFDNDFVDTLRISR